MKKKIVILGSTGSIGKSTVDIIEIDLKNFDVILLTSNNNYSEILKQTKILKPKKHIIVEYENDYQKREMTIDNIDYSTIDFQQYIKDKSWKKICIKIVIKD